MWDFFERRVCLTTVSQQWDRAALEFARVGLTVDKFQSLWDIGPHQSFSRSVRQILIDFHQSEANTLLHLEDDCVFRNLGHLPLAIADLPDDWDLFYLGANLLNGPMPERITEHLFRVRHAWTTHAVAYRRKCVPFLLENQPGFSEQMFDNWMGGQLEKLKAYVVAPMVAYQRPRISSIWGRFDDYTEIFTQSDARLVEARHEGETDGMVAEPANA